MLRLQERAQIDREPGYRYLINHLVFGERSEWNSGSEFAELAP